MKNKTFSLNKIFYKNSLLALFSLVAAFIFWLFVVVSLNPVTTREISGVPVKVVFAESAENAGLTAFYDELTVDVKIEGKRYLISAGKTPDEDFAAVATVYQVTPDKYSFGLDIQCASLNEEDFTVVSQSFSQMDIFVDREAEKTVSAADFELDSTNVIRQYGIDTAAKNIIPEYTVNSVKVKGPETLVSSINKIVVVPVETGMPRDFADTLKCENCMVYAIDRSGVQVNYITVQPETFACNVLVKDATEPEEIILSADNVNIINSPGDDILGDLQFTFSPDAFEFIHSVANNVVLGDINFADIKPGVNNFEFNVTGSDSENADKAPFVVNGKDKKFVATVALGDGYTVKTLNVPTACIDTSRLEDVPSSISEKSTLKLTVCGKDTSVAVFSPTEESKLTAFESDSGVYFAVPKNSGVWIYGYVK